MAHRRGTLKVDLHKISDTPNYLASKLNSIMLFFRGATESRLENVALLANLTSLLLLANYVPLLLPLVNCIFLFKLLHFRPYLCINFRKPSSFIGRRLVLRRAATCDRFGL